MIYNFKMLHNSRVASEAAAASSENNNCNPNDNE